MSLPSQLPQLPQTPEAADKMSMLVQTQPILGVRFFFSYLINSVFWKYLTYQVPGRLSCFSCS